MSSTYLKAHIFFILFTSSRVEKRIDGAAALALSFHGSFASPTLPWGPSRTLEVQHSNSRISTFPTLHAFGKEQYRKFCQKSMERCLLICTTPSWLIKTLVSPLLRKLNSYSKKCRYEHSYYGPCKESSWVKIGVGNKTIHSLWAKAL